MPFVWLASGFGVFMRPNYYYATIGSFIEMRLPPDPANRKLFMLNKTSREYTTAGSFIASSPCGQGLSTGRLPFRHIHEQNSSHPTR
jgi:hypothetical protein